MDFRDFLGVKTGVLEIFWGFIAVYRGVLGGDWGEGGEGVFRV